VVDTGAGEPATVVERRCGLSIPRRIDLIPMIRNRLVVSRTLRSTKLMALPKLIARPDDLESYYLAESAFDPNTLPSQVQRLRGAPVSFVNAPGCHAKVGSFSAWAWADEEGHGWRPDNAAFNAARAFRDGDSFLVADLEMDCQEKVTGATGDLPARFHAWRVSTLSEAAKTEENIRLMQKGLAALESEPALATSNAAYARLRNVAQQPLPERWWFLPRTYARWSLATDGEAALLIVELHGREMINKDGFSAAWLGAWCIGHGGRLESLGLDYLPDALSDTLTHYRHHLEVAGAPNELPLILYSYYALQADSGRYRPYEYAVPAPPRLE
jgi:hypothetical protein